jgi:predicted nucleic acid-binding Zn ribbon protein
MPIREFECLNCEGQRIERMEKLNTSELPPFCPECGNRMVWAPSSMSFSLKGNWPGKDLHMQRGAK